MSTEAEKKAKRIVKKLLFDLTGRRGFDGEWDTADEDVKREIRKTWTGIVLAEIEKGTP